MSKAKKLKKTIAIAATITMTAGVTIGTVAAGELYSDATVGISSAFDRYANTIAGTDKSAEAAEDKGATATDAPYDDTAGEVSVKNRKAADEKKNEIKYPQFEGMCIAVTDDYVNIRAKAGTDSEVVGILADNGLATVEKKGDEWTRVTSGDCTGYIRNDLLLYGDDAGAYVEENCEKMATVSTETLNVREKADVNSDCITQVGRGDSFDIISDDGKWVQIALDDDTAGYISADYVDYTYDLEEAKTIEQIQADIEAAREEEEEAQAQAEADTGEGEEEVEADDYDDSMTEAETDSSEDAQEADDSQDSSQEDENTQDETEDQESETEESKAAAPSGQTGIDLANYAVQFVGNPYVYGGSSLTDGADCSGFVMAVYAQFGYSLPHSAGGQSGYGTPVDTSSLEPGDILFYGYNGSIEHCAIYIGDGMIVHASTPESGIKISSAFYSTPMCAVRLIGQ